MRNLNLLVCVPEYPPHNSSGIANVAYNIVERLKSMGIQCTVCSPKGPNIAIGSANMIYYFGILGLLFYWYRVAEYLNKNGKEYDVVWLHNPLILKTFPLQEILITMHTTYYGYRKHKVKPLIYYKMVSKIESHCLRKFERYDMTGVSPVVCKELEDMGMNKDNITYIPNGVDCKRFRPSQKKSSLREKFKLPKEDKIILSLGRLSDQKQPLKLIQILSLIEKKTAT